MLYICVTIAGTIPVVVCMVLWAVQKQSYNFRLGKRLLLSSMLFYLIPFQMVKYMLPEQLLSALSFPQKDSTEQTLQKFIAVRSVTFSGEAIWIPVWVTVLLFAWLWCIIIFAVYQVVRYRIDIQKLLAKSERAFIEIDGKEAEVFLHKSIHTPYTVGFLHPVIIMPEESLTHPCLSMIYRHEEQHKKNYDSFMKLICIIIICIHWMNPLAILLIILYNITAEYVCDAHAGEGCTDEEKKKYLKLLIELSTVDEPLSMVWRNNLSGSEHLIKRRINYMMRKEKTGLLKRGIAIAASVITVFASASTIFAYEPLFSTNEVSTEVFDGGNFVEFSDDSINNELEFEGADCFFVYEDGTQVQITDEASPYALCNHTLVSGYFRVHKPNNSGGCTIYEYNAKRCSKCGYVEIGTLNNIVTYAVCPH